MGSHESRHSGTKTYQSAEMPLQSTWGPSPRGKIWVLREGRSASAGVGHLSVLVDLGGHSQYAAENQAIPEVFSGVQIHLCLQKRKAFHFTRQVEPNVTFWPMMRKLNVLEQLYLDGLGDVFPVEGALDPLCAWEELEKGPVDWWSRLEPYLCDKMVEYGSGMVQGTQAEETEEEIAQRLREMLKDVERDVRRNSTTTPSLPQGIKRLSKPKSHSYLAVLDEVVQYRVPEAKEAKEEEESLQPELAPNIDETHQNERAIAHDNHHLEKTLGRVYWGPKFNSHSFAQFLVQQVFHLPWPNTLAIQPMEYPKQLADVVKAMVSRSSYKSQ